MTGAVNTSAQRHAAWMHPAARPFVIIGTIGIVGGGLLSAAMAGAPSYHSSWAVAYIVLIPGVAQFLLGTAQAAALGDGVSRRVVTLEALAWNLGNIAVVTGTLTDTPPVLYLGNTLMLAALITIAVMLRRGPRGALRTATWVFIALLIISSAIGIIIQAVTG